MNNSANVTLAEAEEIYKIKADTLKRQCQKGKIKGAIKQGKTWLVPRIPNIDPKRTLTENYPELDFESALYSNHNLYEAEDESKFYLYHKSNSAVFVFEYGYYFVSLFIKQTKIHRNFAVLGALYTESLSSIRSAFLLNLCGYQSDAISLNRRAIENIVRLAACRIKPQDTWKIIQDSSIQKAQYICGINLKRIYSLGSSFAHANIMKVVKTWKEANDNNLESGIPFGPQINQKEYAVALNTSIFLLYLLISSLNLLFPNQTEEIWLLKQKNSAKLLRDYLEGSGALLKEIGEVDKLISRIESI